MMCLDIHTYPLYMFIVLWWASYFNNWSRCCFITGFKYRFHSFLWAFRGIPVRLSELSLTVSTRWDVGDQGDLISGAGQ